MGVVASKAENREEFALAYQRLKQMGQVYLSMRERSGANSQVPEQPLVTARLAVSIFLAGLPETSIANFKPVQEGDLFGVQVRKPKGIIHVHYLTRDELDTISALLDKFMAVKPGQGTFSLRSKVRLLQYEGHSFRKEVGILSLTYRDVYALKAAVLGLQVPFYYSRRDYESALLIVNEAFRKMRSRGLV
jgi:hypothetical protein